MGEPWGGPEICPECDCSSIEYAEQHYCPYCGYIPDIEKFTEHLQQQEQILKDTKRELKESILFIGELERELDRFQNYDPNIKPRRQRHIYSNESFRETGEPEKYLYDTEGCGCCSDAMLELTMEVLDAHIEACKREYWSALQIKRDMQRIEKDNCNRENFNRIHNGLVDALESGKLTQEEFIRAQRQNEEKHGIYTYSRQ